MDAPLGDGAAAVSADGTPDPVGGAEPTGDPPVIR
jgi:hypothetical protein